MVVVRAIAACAMLLCTHFSAGAQERPPDYPGVLKGNATEHAGRVLCVTLSSEGKTAASGSADKTARIWDLTTGKVQYALEHPEAVRSVAFSVGGKTLATGSADSVFVWDASTGKELAKLKGGGVVGRVIFSADGKCLCASGNSWTTIWDADTHKEITRLKVGGTTLGVTPDGTTLALGLNDGSMQLWDVAKGAERASWNAHEGSVFAVTFSPDGKVLATGPFAAGAKGKGKNTTIKLWDVATGKEKAALIGHENGIYSLTFAPNSKALLAADFNGSMKLWDLETSRVMATLGKIKTGDKLKGTPVGQWAISPDLKTWVVGAGQEVSWLDISELYFTRPGVRRYRTPGS